MTRGDLLTRLTAAESEAREAMRTIRCALDDLAAAHEQMRQLRAALPDLDASAAGDASVPVHALVVEHGPCGRPEVCR
jgi:hypothetical protein